MNALLGKVLDAHGGLDSWERYAKVEASIVSGGGLFALKGLPQDADPRRMTVWLHEQRASILPARPTSALCSRRTGSQLRSSMGPWSRSATLHGIPSLRIR